MVGIWQNESISIRDLKSVEALRNIPFRDKADRYAPIVVNVYVGLTDRRLVTGCFSADSKIFTAITMAGIVRRWNIASGDELGMLVSEFRRSTMLHMPLVACSPDGNVVATVIADGFIRIWNVTNGQEVTRLRRRIETE